jgi:hypothetical protein
MKTKTKKRKKPVVKKMKVSRKAGKIVVDGSSMSHEDAGVVDGMFPGFIDGYGGYPGDGLS